MREPETLVGAWLVAPGVMPGPLNQSAATYFMLRDSAQSFQDIGLWNNRSATVTGRGEPEQVETLDVTDGTLPILGINPALGRSFSKEDDLPSGPDVVMITHRYWQRAFGGRPRRDRASLMVERHGARGDRRAAGGFHVPARRPARDRADAARSRDRSRAGSITRASRGSSRASRIARPTPMSSACCRR